MIDTTSWATMTDTTSWANINLEQDPLDLFYDIRGGLSKMHNVQHGLVIVLQRWGYDQISSTSAVAIPLTVKFSVKFPVISNSRCDTMNKILRHVLKLEVPRLFFKWLNYCND